MDTDESSAVDSGETKIHLAGTVFNEIAMPSRPRCTILFAVLDFMGIAISRTVAFTLLCILIRNSTHSFQTYQCLCV